MTAKKSKTTPAPGDPEDPDLSGHTSTHAAALTVRTSLSGIMEKNLADLEDPTVDKFSAAAGRSLDEYSKVVLRSVSAKKIADLMATAATNVLLDATRKVLGISAWGDWARDSPVKNLLEGVVARHQAAFESRVDALAEKLWKQHEDENVVQWGRTYQREFTGRFEYYVKQVAAKRADMRVQKILEEHKVPHEVVRELMQDIARGYARQ